jgi:hypothetical protein
MMDKKWQLKKDEDNDYIATANYASLNEFYQDCESLHEDGYKSEFSERKEADDEDWMGLSRTDILKSKYTYPFNPDSVDVNPASSSSLTTFYSEDDGFDLNYDRLLEGLPSLVNVKRGIGGNMGKFITIAVSIDECCRVSSKAMLSKAKFAASLIDSLESAGKRVRVIGCAYIADGGRIHDTKISELRYEILLKDYDEPLVVQNIYTAISSWMFRYWMLLNMAANCHPSFGYGHPSKNAHYKSDDEVAVIEICNGECLDANGCKKKEAEILKQFDLSED